jgi:hypothetical protein
VVRPRDAAAHWAARSTLLYSAAARAAWLPLLMEVTVPGPRGSGLPDRLDLLAPPPGAAGAAAAPAVAPAAAAAQPAALRAP